ncbi:MAG: GDYXXLXY domain-containing protein, partial [Rhizobacter sp.]
EVMRELGRRPAASASWNLLQATSVLLAAAAAWRLAVAWPDMRRAWWAGVALGMVVLAGFMPALGAALFALAWCAVDHRWRLAAAAGVAAAWIIGSFYYALAWPLATKAAVLVIAAGWLGAMAWWSWPRPAAVAVPAARPARHGAASVGIALSAVATLVTANVGIWQKQELIAHGEAVFIELAPVDPRSLMQGDYMRLRFRVPAGLDQQLDRVLGGQRPRLVARRDARGVATLQHLDTGTSLATDELRIELTPNNGRWTVVTDAWFFPEGQAARWARARYGEFRVDARGRALLVGLRGAQLEAL